MYEKQAMEIVQDRRQQKAAKKFAKQATILKKQQQEKEKKEAIESVKQWRKGMLCFSLSLCCVSALCFFLQPSSLSLAHIPLLALFLFLYRSQAWLLCVGNG